MHEVLSSRNLFLDSSDGVGQGDNFTLELSQDSITAGDGQQLKLTLMNFKGLPMGQESTMICSFALTCSQNSLKHRVHLWVPGVPLSVT